ncbi:hypothetical protein PPYR_12738 [Photinus pyralis]|uniref:C2H2-type domain-containing protein n=2 Tax=Photinus pyralis TaxID=7054 RepID=A0A5N4A782_PHOPY|nr:uncharacterized protein LOC116178339 [Photinus pyralis]KAB0793118.1 hypothetical protein PPYR_12738 [Photinus pyralis]
MFICYLCNLGVRSLTALSCHFKFVHKLSTESIYRCKQGDCQRTFCQYNSFRKHLKAKHVLEGGVNNSTSDDAFICDQRALTDSQNLSLDGNSDDNFDDEIEEGMIISDSDITTFKDLIKAQARTFVAKLYSFESLPRSMVQIVIDEFLNFMSGGFVDVIQRRVNSKMSSLDIDENFVTTTDSMFDALKNPFQFLSSEYLRFKDLASTNDLIRPVSYDVGYRISANNSKLHTSLGQVPLSIQFVPVRLVLKQLFELPRFHEQVCDYVNSLKHCTTVTSFIQSDLWKSKLTKYNVEDTVLPLFIYFDDYEACNPLGSHAGVYKIGAIYASFPFLPPQFRSTLDNIILVSLFHSEDRKQVGNRKILDPIISELTFLEENGITIIINGKTLRIYFVLGLVIGDNLGLHSIMGFNESFSSNHYCRFCTSSKKDMESLCNIKNVTLRNKTNYNEHILLNDASQTGIKEACVFNEIPSFHVCDNLSVDIMHDILEGVCHYDMLNMLNYYINVKKLFSLDTLNWRINTFRYNFDLKNKPPAISRNFEKKSKISMSASEMMCFIKYFGVMMGDLVPVDDPVWELYLCLREILDVVLSNAVTTEIANMFETLVSEHNELFITLFNEKLKPKFHFILHYASIMKMVGPLRHIWSMRYESKHRQSKVTAGVTCSRRNILYTLALKHQLILANRFLNNHVLKRNYSLGPNICMGDTMLTDINYPANFKDCPIYKWISINGITYRNGICLVTDLSDLIPSFGIINFIMIGKNNKMGFVCYATEVICLNRHYHAYEVIVNFDSNFFIEFDELTNPFPCHLYKSSNSSFVTLNHSV